MTDYLYWFWENEISINVCKLILDQVNWGDATQGMLGQNNVIELITRKTDVIWQQQQSLAGCILQTYIRTANKNAGWNFEITSSEDIQIAKYEDGGHYSWHVDAHAPIQNIQRKLSAVLLLNDASEFEGGELEFEDTKFEGLKKAGSIVVFPSYIKHRVTPVTKGIRYSTTCWMHGPAFK